MKNIYVLTTVVMFGISATLAAIGGNPKVTRSVPAISTALMQLHK